MKNKIRAVPRPFRILGYLFLIFSMAAMYVFFRSYLLLFFVVFLSVIPWISVLLGYLIAKKVHCCVRIMNENSIIPGDNISPFIEVYNPLYIGSLDMRLSVEAWNIFFSKKEEMESFDVSLPVIARKNRKTEGKSFIRLPLTATLIGVYRIGITGACVQDPFGLIKYRIRLRESLGSAAGIHSESHSHSAGTWQTEADFTVLPRVTGGKQPDSETISVGMTEVEESGKRGNDFSEVTDIREYIPGDRIRDIHWKVSARMEEWMVKVRTQMAGMELSVVLTPEHDEKTTEYIITYAYQELRTWSLAETDIRLLVYTSGPEAVRRYTLSTPEDVDEAFKNIMSEHYLTHIPEGSDPKMAVDGIIKNLYPFMGGYIRFGLLDDGTIGFASVEGVSV